MLKPFRCQPTTVSALTRCKARRQGAHSRASATQNTRSFPLSLGTPFRLFSTPSCCRRAKFSRAKSRRSRRAATITIPSQRIASIMVWSVEGTACNQWPSARWSFGEARDSELIAALHASQVPDVVFLADPFFGPLHRDVAFLGEGLHPAVIIVGPLTQDLLADGVDLVEV